MGSILNTRKFKFLVVFLISSITLVAFQNCTKTSFSSAPPQKLVEASAALLLTTEKDMLFETSMNTVLEFTLSPDQQVTDIRSTLGINGQFEIIDQNTLRIKYTPDWGFRGKDTVIIKVKDSVGNEIKFNVSVVVGNALKSLEPALAIRGMGCIQCHAQVSSNIITDFGYKNNYYFGTNTSDTWWNNGSVYGDHGNNFNTINIPSDKSVFVPKANLPATIAAALGLQTIADYIKSQFAISGHPSTKEAKVVEKTSVYIGAPTVSDITSSFRLSINERSKYFKNSESSIAFKGLKDEGTFFKNDDTLECEGDFALRGPLLLDNLKVKSKSGCRLYVIGSVFIFGGITYENTDADRNLQITSTKSISLGLGSAVKDNANCDASRQYGAGNGHGPSSLTHRLVNFWTTVGYYVRQSNNPTGFGQSIVDEADLIQAEVGTFYDATCRPEGRAVSYDRIILNAPIVNSRYQGNISGTIIAEFSLMSLGSFKFSYDQVFARVPIFPFLEQSMYLDIKD